MSAPEILCDMVMLKAQYHEKKNNEGARQHYFEVQIVSENKTVHFDIPLNSGELFAAEIDVLASIIRARVIKAGMTGNQSG